MVVDNSTFSPIGLTVHSDALYYQEALDISISSGEDRYGFPRFPDSARVLPSPLSGAALAS